MNESSEQIEAMIDAIPTMAWSCLPDGACDFLNRRWYDYTGLSRQDAAGWGWSATIHPKDQADVIAKWKEVLASGRPGEVEARVRRSDGAYRWFLIRAHPLHHADGTIIKWYGINTDIEDRKRAEFLLSAEKRTLEMVARGAPLNEILNNLCNTIDAQARNIISTVLLTDPDGKHLRPAAGPRVPNTWSQTITPLEIGPQMGSCGTAAFLKKRIITSDIASDVLWSEHPEVRDIAISNGLRASWSQPLLSKDQQVLGTFAMYYPEPRSPSIDEIQLIEGAAHIAIIAIEGERSQKALAQAFDELRKSQDQLEQIVNAIPQHIAVLAPDGSALYVNRRVLGYTGQPLENIEGKQLLLRVFHPDDVQRVQEQRQAALLQGEPFELEMRARRHNGQYRWFLIQYNPVRDENGQILRWYATSTDIHDRKQSEERVHRENLALREDIDRSSMFEEIVGSSQPLRRVLSEVAKVAPTDSTVLIQGETGTGKELIARAIHKRSNRSARAFIRVNCAAIPQSLIASELFGHEKGAFTGATQRRLGRFESADGGTIFLDEIGELSGEIQASLLRVLQEHEFERVGSSQSIHLDVRVITATNRDLKTAVASGAFREDLFYRLNVFPIQVPSLRQRADDIPLLLEYLIDRYAKKSGKKIRHVDKETLDLFQSYDWPGNIRELQNVVERAVILNDGDTFSVNKTWLDRQSMAASKPRVDFVSTMETQERVIIEAALEECRGRIAGPAGAAKKLGIPRQTLESKILSLHIDKHRFKSSVRK